MKYIDDTSTERISNLKSLLDNFEEAKKISERMARNI